MAKTRSKQTIARASAPRDALARTPEDMDRLRLKVARSPHRSSPMRRRVAYVSGALLPARKRCIAPHVECNNAPPEPGVPPE